MHPPMILPRGADLQDEQPMEDPGAPHPNPAHWDFSLGMESVDNPLLTTFSTRLGRTTLARGILTGSLLGCTVLRGILIGRLVIVSPLLTEVLSLKTCKIKRESKVLTQDIEKVFKVVITCSFLCVCHSPTPVFLRNYRTGNSDCNIRQGRHGAAWLPAPGSWDSGIQQHRNV